MLPMCPPDAVGCRDALTTFDSPGTWVLLAALVVALVVVGILIVRRRRRD